MAGLSSRGIFLSYRREDAAPYARLLQFQLRERIPDARVFLDMDSIEPGLDFAEVIREALDSCAVLVALIGRQWATLADEEGRRRLDNPDDYVRFEVQTALERGVLVIPVLVDGARPLRQQQLPAELQKLARLNALELSYGRYEYEANRLIDLIQRVLAAASDTVHQAAFPAYASQEPSLVGHSTDVETEATISRLDGRQLKLINDALVSSYDHEALDRDLLFELDKRLDEISAPDSLPNVVFRVLRAAQSQGWLLELLRMLQNSRYPEVREAATRMLTEVGSPQRGGVRGESPVLSRRVVFLCHSSSDKPSVRELRAKLISDGMQPWLDEEDILPGENWEEAIRKAIRASNTVLVCLSMTSVSKVGYLQTEIKTVLDAADEQPEGTIFLIPVRLEPCEVPPRLTKWQWVDLFDESGYRRLMRSLRAVTPTN